MYSMSSMARNPRKHRPRRRDLRRRIRPCSRLAPKKGYSSKPMGASVLGGRSVFHRRLPQIGRNQRDGDKTPPIRLQSLSICFSVINFCFTLSPNVFVLSA